MNVDNIKAVLLFADEAHQLVSDALTELVEVHITVVSYSASKVDTFLGLILFVVSRIFVKLLLKTVDQISVDLFDAVQIRILDFFMDTCL